MFLDKATIRVKAGDGGDGCSSFRREKFVPRGGPDGGNGGKGGDVLIRGRADMNTLLDFAYRNIYAAEDGGRGQGSNKHGRNGRNLTLEVPVGTIVKDHPRGNVLKDLRNDGQCVRVARGGKGGRGNKSFATATNRAPRNWEPGTPGEERQIELELRLIADVGLIGFPNAGKSTLLGKISAAHPKVADYPFTTTKPELGIVELDDFRRIVVADIPGIIEGAHAGTGLGDEFLRHVKRTRVLLYLIDVSPAADIPPEKAYEVLRQEVKLYDASLFEKPYLVAANKMDLPGTEDRVKEFAKELEGLRLYPISALLGRGLRDLLSATVALLDQQNPPE